MFSRATPFGAWLLYDVLAPQRTLPVVALGVAFGLARGPALVAACALLGLGLIAGFTGEYWLLWLLDKIPGAATHFFLTGPICYLATGLALIAGVRLRVVLLPAAAAIVGAMLAILIRITDPSLHEPVFTGVPILIVLWIVAAFACLVRTFWRDRFPVFGRILGSWMLAIGLLYGGVSVVPPPKPPPPPAPEFLPERLQRP